MHAIVSKQIKLLILNIWRSISALYYACPFEFVVLLLVFFTSLCFLLVGWGNPIMDAYSFRQTQTALTSYHFIHDGFRLDYLTPVFGPPWKIPFEFPVYQGIVSVLSIVAEFPLDQAGRFVSVLFYYLSLLYVILLLKELDLGTRRILLSVSLVLMAPVYIFWSRSFMIESTAMFFCMAYVYYSVKYQKGSSLIYLLLSLVCAIMGALTKITTFVPFVVFTGLLTIYIGYDKKNITRLFGKMLLQIVIAVIPMMLSIVFTRYGDYYKELNPLSRFITSHNLLSWNFGSFDQRFSLNTWAQIVKYLKINMSYMFFVLLLIYLITLNRYKSFFPMILFAAMASAPMIFTNLYYVHSYYYYPVCFFGCILMAEVVSFFVNKTNLYRFLILMIVGAMTYTYLGGYYKKQTYQGSTTKREMEIYNLSLKVKAISEPCDIVLICGDDWNSRIPYYSERKAVMIREHQNRLDVEHVLKTIGSSKVRIIVQNRVDQQQYQYVHTYLKDNNYSLVEEHVSGFTIYRAR